MHFLQVIKDCSKAVFGNKNQFDLILTYGICSLSLDDGVVVSLRIEMECAIETTNNFV